MKLTCCDLAQKKIKLKTAVKFLKVISDENRLNILRILRDKELSVSEIWQYLDLSQNLVSHHLKVLKDFGLVDSQKNGMKVIYSLNLSNAKRYKALLINFI
ncbi:metalloregulator ArsR/SmtB family transcription factor [Candidatus Parcubacteria bacterium]|nr:metalloregulator ArsR/SmtB family transcription factor [Patescibacteria group bacterium]MBU4309308.1 metalloregulator ArsR/SmtB family transcription factor [Patescibacteria group bacterium]MBU4432285.1 metalloregulator ArsR/SmtB family transcription factor [Patescibacteria group bacterium]MBU4577669.1 metalloregulator ArsR/SmtB family transcription factor [Patescibacteria group bacterium]MCG2697355.1 metalloregulator ArsR/SmtB family transcription factor [Candidatus Parcubacteria bacterium]